MYINIITKVFRDIVQLIVSDAAQWYRLKILPLVMQNNADT